MLNTEIFKEDLAGLYNRYNECIYEIVVQNKILDEYIVEDGFLAEAEDPLIAIDNLEKELAKIKKEIDEYVALMGDYKSIDEIGEAIFEIENEIMNDKYGSDGAKVAILSEISDELKHKFDKAFDIIDKYVINVFE